MAEKPPIRILIINPNTNQSMTDSLRSPIDSLNYNNTTYTYLTPPPSPTHPPSINTPHDAFLSTPLTLPHALPHLRTHAAVLLACYSPHPLVPALRAHTRIPVLGILEASVAVARSLLRDEEGERFGIVSTGDVWRGVLGEAVRGLLGGAQERVFQGVECVGLGAGELHREGEGEVEGRVRAAVRRLVMGEGRVGVVVLGCAGMVGMEEWVRGECGEGVRVVDAVKAGVGILQGLVRGGF